MTLHQIYEANAYTSCGLGLPLNMLLFYVIARHTPQEMQVYSLLLMQTCVADLTSICVQTIVQPVINSIFVKSIFFLNLGQIVQLSLVEDDGTYTTLNIGPPVRNLLFPWNLVFFEV